MSEKVAKLQDQIDLLLTNAANCTPPTQQSAPPTPISTAVLEQPTLATGSNQKDLLMSAHEHQSPRPARHPQYMGPTSSSFSFGVAKRSLQGMGIQTGADASTSYASTPTRRSSTSNYLSMARDPLYTISRNEAFRLIESYEEECGTIYAFLDIKLMLKTAREFYDCVSIDREPSYLQGDNDENIFSGGILDLVKLSIAVALVIKASGPTVLSTGLLESVEAGFKGRFCGLSVDILGMQVLTLMV